jgi:hypothetical chaperone protein
MTQASLGVDFGTSNTVVSLATGDGDVKTIRFPHGDATPTVYPSALCFWQERRGLPASAEGGSWAFERVLEHHGAMRFLQSFKTLAASRSFQSTAIFGQRYLFEDVLAAFLRTLTRHAGSAVDLACARVTIGRPVRFAGANPDEALAMQRYRDAFARLGVAEAAYVYEPVGAAFSFARGLERDATVLVADFGGGTSDFSLMRFAVGARGVTAEPLAHSGVGVAGDVFDYRIVEKVVSPRLGKGGSYRTFGKTLPIPSHYYAKLARWHELALMKGGAELRELRELARDALDPAPLEAFIEIVEQDLGLSLYRAVAAAKVGLSSAQRVEFRFRDMDIDIGAEISRVEFEGWIAEDLADIAAAVDRVMQEAGLGADRVDKVFLTGGTSFVPAVQRLFVERFGREKLTSADQFESISKGLALIGRSENPGQWAVGNNTKMRR